MTTIKLPEYIEKIYPSKSSWNELSLGLGVEEEIVVDLKKYNSLLITGTTGSGKSVMMRNIIFHAIEHSRSFQMYGIDLKRVELTPYAKYHDTVMNVATTLSDALETLRCIQEEMMKRYEQIRNLEFNHYSQLPSHPKSILLVVDEAYLLLAPESIKTDEGRANDEMHREAMEILSSISRLSRAAGIYMVIGTQRPDAKILSSGLKSNIPVRVMAGRSDTVASVMTLDNDNATRLPNIRGRGYLQIHGVGQEFQGYFVSSNEVTQWLPHCS